MSATKELMLEACENIGLDPTKCVEWSPETLAAVQCDMGRILASKAEGVVTSDVQEQN